MLNTLHAVSPHLVFIDILILHTPRLKKGEFLHI